MLNQKYYEKVQTNFFKVFRKLLSPTFCRGFFFSHLTDVQCFPKSDFGNANL